MNLKGTVARRFKDSGPVNAEDNFVVDRTAWHLELANSLRQGRCLLLHGHRQDGKSSSARAVATMLEREEGRWLTLSVTFEGLSTRTDDSAWAAFEMHVRGAARALGSRLASRGVLAPPAVMQAQAKSPPLFHDVASFCLFWGRENWGGYSVALVIDEFDALLSVPGTVRASILSGIRATRTLSAITPTGSVGGGAAGGYLPDLALESVLAIGVDRVLQLSDGNGQCTSPFNVADAVRPPLAAFAGLSAMIAQFDRENAVTTPAEVVHDIVWRCGGHVGVASFLCSKLSKLFSFWGSRGVDVAAWWALITSPELQKSLQESATIQSMLRCVELGPDCSPQTISARAIVRSLLIVPGWNAVPLATMGSSAAVSQLLSEGVIVHVDSTADVASQVDEDLDAAAPAASTSESAQQLGTAACAPASGIATAPVEAFRISAPLLAQQLLLAVGPMSQFFSTVPPSLRFSTVSRTDSRLDLVKTVVECFPYFGADGLSHPLGLLQDKTPCAFAFHAPLYTILRARGNAQYIYVGFEARDLGRRPLRRLDIALVDGTRAGIELLVNSVDLNGHVTEQAAAYSREQRLANVLVVNFCSSLMQMKLDYRVPPAAASLNVELMHVLYDSVGQTMTPFIFDRLSNSFLSSTPIALLSSATLPAGSFVNTLQAYEEAAVAKAEAARASQMAGSAAVLSAPSQSIEMTEACRRDAEARRRDAEAHCRDAEAHCRDAEARCRDAEAHCRDAEAGRRDAEAGRKDAEAKVALLEARLRSVRG